MSANMLTLAVIGLYTTALLGYATTHLTIRGVTTNV